MTSQSSGNSTLNGIEIFYAFATTVSILSSVASIYMTVKADKSQLKTPLYFSQISVFVSLCFYHIFAIITYFMEILVFDNVVSVFDAFYGLRYPQIGLFVALEIFLFSGIMWLLLIWNKLMSIHYLSFLNPFLRVLDNTGMISKFMILMYIIPSMLHLVFLAVAFDDGIRVRVLSYCVSGSIEVFLFIMSVIMFIDIVGLLIKARTGSSSTSKDVTKAIWKLCIVCGFASVASLLGFLTAFKEVFAFKDRLTMNVPRNTLESDSAIFASIRIDSSRLLWAFNGLICSIPFLLKQAQIRHKTTIFKSTATKTNETTRSQTVLKNS